MSAAALSGCVAKPTDGVEASASYPGADYAALADCTYASWPLANQYQLNFTPFPSLAETRISVGGGGEVAALYTFRRVEGGAVLEVRASYMGDWMAAIKPYADGCAARPANG